MEHPARWWGEIAMRPLRNDEVAVLDRLLEMVPNDARPRLDYELLVEDMKDGGMGSIRFANETGETTKMGSELVTAEYIDEDQVSVLISINLDENGGFSRWTSGRSITSP
jgi:hypothetical protein